MTHKQMLKLQKIREYSGLIGWCLMVINLFIGLVALVISLMSKEPVVYQHKTMVFIYAIAMIIGLMAVIDMYSARKIAYYTNKVFRSEL